MSQLLDSLEIVINRRLRKKEELQYPVNMSAKFWPDPASTRLYLLFHCWFRIRTDAEGISTQGYQTSVIFDKEDLGVYTDSKQFQVLLEYRYSDAIRTFNKWAKSVEDTDVLTYSDGTAIRILGVDWTGKGIPEDGFTSWVKRVRRENGLQGSGEGL